MITGLKLLKGQTNAHVVSGSNAAELSRLFAGRQRLDSAMPLWRDVQQRVEAALGLEAPLALNGLSDRSATKLTT